ncbi:DinB family protein [Paractinoplanes lichenicola]|uniref:DinB family protein n=1 Tax=Paractinoplanes lichenicola TaxID=2802976 RepID=A0ABS1VTG3_9ACTN|nr:DinB family protein [Actinoplanes lichenicola]MBL7257739.1 DinB family protein [Actinoplanes lichenicola]
MIDDSAIKADLVKYLQSARDALVWKLDGLSEYDIRRPLVPTGTNLLGLIKHCAIIEAGYFGDTFGRPFPEPMPWLDDDAEPNADMWATASETRDDIVGLYQRVWAHAAETISGRALDGLGAVPWWPAETREVPLHRVLVHVTAEVQRHAGHADVVRELIDGAAGLSSKNTNMPEADAQWWVAYRDRLEEVARSV